jgi:Integral membrane protein possibly involved in chromosome condensation
MTVEPLLVGVGGALGAVGRYAVGLALSDWQFPLPTVVVNVVGSFVFALLVALGAGDHAVALLAVGFCGAFTTFATFSVDAVRLGERSRVATIGYIAGTLAACLLGVALAAGFAAVLR